MNPETKRHWIQCDACFKWRFLSVASNLPDKWYCFMNYSQEYNSCSVPQQSLTPLDENEAVSPDHSYSNETNIVECIDSVINKNIPKMEICNEDVKKANIIGKKLSKKTKLKGSMKKRRISSCPTLVKEPAPFTAFKEQKAEYNRNDFIREISEKVVEDLIFALQNSSTGVQNSSKKSIRRVSIGVQVNLDAPAYPGDADVMRRLLENQVQLVANQKKFQTDVARLLEGLLPGLDVEKTGNVQKMVEELLGATLMMNFRQKAP